MGWTFTRKPQGIAPKTFLDERFTQSAVGPNGEPRGSFDILDSAMIGSTYYAACRRTYADGSAPVVFALICLTQRDSKSDYNFGWKDMTEDMGPCESDCPARILALLDPTDSEYAKAWRQRCRDNLARPKPKPGQRVRFAEPIKFTNGESLSDFRYVKGSRFQSIAQESAGSCLYRVSGWKKRAFEILSA